MNALVALYRSFSRHPRFALINLGGLALGIAVFLILLLYVRFETSFDRVLPGAEEVWVVDRTLQFGEAEPVIIPSRTDMLELLQEDFSGTRGARLLEAKVAVQSRGQAVQEDLGLIDPAYFDLFPLTVVAGDPKAAIERPDGAVITQSAAARHLRPGDPLGQTLTVVVGTQPRALRVAAVAEDPPIAMTHRPQIFAKLTPGQETFFEGAKGLKTFLQFSEKAAAIEMNAKLPEFTERHPDPNFSGPADYLKVTETLVPLASEHLKQPRDQLVVATLGVLGLVALGLAIVNYINLATARADLRAREVALRKVVGAPRGALVRQFLGEALAAACIAGVAGLALAELALPFINATGGLKLTITYFDWSGVLLPLALTVLLTGIAAGFYPAFALSRFQPASVLSSNRSPGTGRRGAFLRAALVVGQFAVAIALMICTGILFAQARHVQNADLGFERDGLIVIESFANPNLDPSQRGGLRRAIKALPSVTGTTTSGIIPTGGTFWMSKSEAEGYLPVQVDLLHGDVGADFFDLYGLRLLAGRRFDQERFPADLTMEPERTPGVSITAGQFNTIINRAAVEALGFPTPQEAIGKQIRAVNNLTIIGVVENANFTSPTQPVAAFAYSLREDAGFTPRLAVRHSGAAEATLEQIEAVWQANAGNVPFEGFSVNAQIYEQYLENDVQRSRLFAFGSALAVGVGALGLYGLAAFNTSRRVREIGIRKSLGASSSAIARLLIGQFMRPVLIANLIAWPLAWLAMREWLDGFAERIELSPVYFISASALALTIAVLTVLAQALQASRVAPAEALRQD